jgi:uncharacterized protein YdaU (DUF1376 family)
MAIQWYPRYPGDYSRDTRSLSLAEHGAYTLLLDELYVTAKPLPSDLMQLHRICGAHSQAEQAAVAKVIERYFVKSMGGWVQLRAMLEIQKQLKISEKRRAAAYKSHGVGLALEGPEAPALALPEQTHPHLHPHLHPELQLQPQRAYALPPWLDVQAWTEWEVYRRERRKTLTPSTARKQIKFLEQNQADHVAIINKAIEKGWQGLFPLQEDHGGKAGTGGDVKVAPGVSARDRVGRATASRSGAARKRGEGGDT